MKSSHFNLIRVLLTFALSILISFQGFSQNSESLNSASFRVKFKEDRAKKLDQYTKEGKTISKNISAVTGLTTLDQLNAKHAVYNLERVFPDAGKFEERHRKYGLHLWYEVKVNSKAGTDINKIISEYRKDDNIMVAEGIYTYELHDEIQPSPTYTPDDPLLNQ